MWSLNAFRPSCTGHPYAHWAGCPVQGPDHDLIRSISCETHPVPPRLPAEHTTVPDWMGAAEEGS